MSRPVSTIKVHVVVLVCGQSKQQLACLLRVIWHWYLIRWPSSYRPLKEHDRSLRELSKADQIKVKLFLPLKRREGLIGIVIVIDSRSLLTSKQVQQLLISWPLRLKEEEEDSPSGQRIAPLPFKKFQVGSSTLIGRGRMSSALQSIKQIDCFPHRAKLASLSTQTTLTHAPDFGSCVNNCNSE